VRRPVYAFAALALLCLLLSGAALLLAVHYDNVQQAAGQREVARLQTAVLASCAFAADLGTVPLPPEPKPSKLGVQLVADSRAQWRKLGCPGSLPVPSGFARWAAYYHLPED